MKELLWILGALGLTLAVELPLSAVWWRKSSAVVDVLLVNMLTNPLINVALWAVAVALDGRPPLYWVILAALEVTVVAVEGLLLGKLRRVTALRGLIFAAVANVISYFTGLLLELVGIL